METTTTMEQIEKWFATTPDGQQVQAALKAQDIAERRKACEEIAALNKEAERALKPLLAAKSKADKEVEQARQAWEAAIAERQRLHAECSSVSHATDRKVGKLRRQLEETADPGIDAFITKCDRLEDLFRAGYSRTSNFGSAAMWQFAVVSGSSNHEAILQHLDKIASIRKKAEGLKHEPDASQALAKLEQLLPSHRDAMNLENKITPPTKVLA